MADASSRFPWPLVLAAALAAILVGAAAAWFLPFIPCPPEAHGLASRRGCVPCLGEERITLKEWLQIRRPAP